MTVHLALDAPHYRILLRSDRDPEVILELNGDEFEQLLTCMRAGFYDRWADRARHRWGKKPLSRGTPAEAGLLTESQLCRLLGVDRNTAQTWRRDGLLRAYIGPGGHVYYPLLWVERRLRFSLREVGRLVSPKEARQRLGVTAPVLRDYQKARLLRAVQLPSGEWRWVLDDIERVLRGDPDADAVGT